MTGHRYNLKKGFCQIKIFFSPIFSLISFFTLVIENKLNSKSVAIKEQSNFELTSVLRVGSKSNKKFKFLICKMPFFYNKIKSLPQTLIFETFRSTLDIPSYDFCEIR